MIIHVKSCKKLSKENAHELIPFSSHCRQMTNVRQNILSMIMLKNVKLCNGNIRLHLATPNIYKARNISSNPRISITFQLLLVQVFVKDVCCHVFRYCAAESHFSASSIPKVPHNFQQRKKNYCKLSIRIIIRVSSDDSLCIVETCLAIRPVMPSISGDLEEHARFMQLLNSAD